MEEVCTGKLALPRWLAGRLMAGYPMNTSGATFAGLETAPVDVWELRLRMPNWSIALSVAVLSMTDLHIGHSFLIAGLGIAELPKGAEPWYSSLETG